MGEKNNIPQIRFKKFEDNWKKLELFQIVDLRSGRDYKHLTSGNIPVYGTGGYMLSVNKALSYNEDAVGIGRKGTIDKPYILKAPFWTVDTLFYAVPRNHHSLDFIHAIFQNINWKRKDESTGVPSLSKVAINNITTYSTSINEQSQIGTYFQNLDKLITLQQQKHDKLVTLKKAILDKMLPKEGADVPEIRFKGFAGGWEYRELEDIAAEKYGGGTPRTSVEKYWNGFIPWIQSSDLIEGDVTKVYPKKFISESGLRNSSTKLIPQNSIAIITRVGVGKLAYLPFSYSTSQDFFSLSKLNIDAWFGVYSIYKKLNGEPNAVQGTSIKGITKEELLSKRIYVPNNPNEQVQIGSYFQNIDKLISLHQQEIQKLKNLKKACLEKMFV